MFYLGIDQHARQITISLRDEDGDVLMARQVSTKPEKIHEFFQRLTRERLQNELHGVTGRSIRKLHSISDDRREINGLKCENRTSHNSRAGLKTEFD